MASPRVRTPRPSGREQAHRPGPAGEPPLFTAQGVEVKRVTPANGKQRRAWVGIRRAVPGFTGTGYGWGRGEEEGELLTPGTAAIAQERKRQQF